MHDFKLDNFLPYKLSILSQTVSGLIAQEYESRFGLNMNQWRCMVIISSHNGVSARRICDQTLLDKMTVSRAIRKLESRHLISLSASSKDARKRLIKLTTTGQAIYEDVLPIARSYESSLLATLTESENQALDSIAKKLIFAAQQLKTAP